VRRPRLSKGRIAARASLLGEATEGFECVITRDRGGGEIPLTGPSPPEH